MSALSGARTLAIIETQSAIASASLALDGVMALVVSRAREITGAAAGVVELIEGEEIVCRAASGTAVAFLGTRLAMKTSPLVRCLRRNEVFLCEDADDAASVDRAACLKVGARSMLCVPLVHGKRAVGVLKVYDPNAHAFGEDDVTTLRVLSGIIATAMAHSSYFELQRDQSRHDALTGLRNRQAFDDQLEREIARASRYRDKLTLCLADLDAFEAINHSQGYTAGDGVLRAVAAILKRFRDTDRAFRFGGDEFAVIFPRVDYVSARRAVSRAQAAVERDPDCLGVGLSWGLADLWTQDPDTLMMRADAALYKAKEERRRARVARDVQGDQMPPAHMALDDESGRPAERVP